MVQNVPYSWQKAQTQLQDHKSARQRTGGTHKPPNEREEASSLGTDTAKNISQKKAR
jgi:hypothetical protein